MEYSGRPSKQPIIETGASQCGKPRFLHAWRDEKKDLRLRKSLDMRLQSGEGQALDEVIQRGVVVGLAPCDQDLLGLVLAHERNEHDVLRADVPRVGVFRHDAATIIRMLSISLERRRILGW